MCGYESGIVFLADATNAATLFRLLDALTARAQ
jgi:hypothetical protein